MNSEYNNAGELMGINDLTPEMAGYIGSLDAVTKQKVINKVAKKPQPSQGSRAEMEKYFSELPDPIKTGLLDGKLRLADHVIYSVKAVNASKTIKMFESQDVKEVGLRNISNGKLPKNMAMIVSGIYVLAGVAASGGADDIKSTNYDVIDAKYALCTGEFTLKSNKKQILSGAAMTLFKTTGFSLVPKGYYKLANPRIIQDDVDIDFDIELGTTTGIAANTYITIGLHGTVTIP